MNFLFRQCSVGVDVELLPTPFSNVSVGNKFTDEITDGTGEGEVTGFRDTFFRPTTSIPKKRHGLYCRANDAPHY
jgi:hypothetical protein